MVEGAAVTGNMRASRNLNGIQTLRGIAALMVVFHHALGEADTYLSAALHTPAGGAGVDIFFVISGFIMLYISYPTEQRAITPQRFLTSRVLRIYPFYWVCLSLVFVLWQFGLYHSLHPDMSLTLRSALLLPNDKYILGVSWTLVYEMYFYVIFSLCLLLNSRTLSVIAAISTIMFLLIFSHLLPNGIARSFMTNPIALEFCFGLIIAYLFVNSMLSARLLRYGWILGLLAIVLAPVLLPYGDPAAGYGHLRVVVWGLPAALIVASFLFMDTSRRPLLRWTILLGNASYALYLTHPFVMTAYAWVLNHSPGVASEPQIAVIPVVVAICIMIGVAAHLVMEKPLTNMLRANLPAGRLLKGSRPTTDGDRAIGRSH